MRRVLAALLGAGLVVVAGAAPAAAHGAGEVRSTNYLSEITDITPSVPGLKVRLLDLGRRIEVVNETGRELTVLGYQNEPYLRVGPSGVSENRNAPSLYQDEAGEPSEVAALPPHADPGAVPDWQRRSGGERLTWSDHRTRWEGADPPGVEADPGRKQTVVPRWMIPMLLGNEPVVVGGQIAWVPGPALAPWFLAAAALFAATVAAGASRWWRGLLSVSLGLLVAVDMARVLGVATREGEPLVGALLDAMPSAALDVLAWAAGIWAVVAMQRRRSLGLAAAMAVGLFLGFVSGVGDLLDLAYSQVPTALPDAAARATVVVALGVGFGLVGGGFLAMRKVGAIFQTEAPPA